MAAILSFYHFIIFSFFIFSIKPPAVRDQFTILILKSNRRWENFGREGKNGRARGRHAKEVRVLYAAMIAAHLGSPEIIKQQINSGTGSF